MKRNFKKNWEVKRCCRGRRARRENKTNKQNESGGEANRQRGETKKGA